MMKNNYKKILSNLVILVLASVNSFALVVQETTGNIPVTKDNITMFGGIAINWTVITPIVIIGIIVTIFLMIFMWIINKVIKKIRANKKAKEDLEFNKYSLDMKNCQLNKNLKYKKKNVFWFFLLFWRAKIYARTSDGKKFIGFYDGECVKKEGYFILAVMLKYSFFKSETDLVLFPFNLKKHLISFNDDKTIDLDIEGIDEVLSSEYFSIPVFKDESDSEKKQIFVDFSDDIRKNYFETYVYRDVLKENIKEFASNVKEASEMNSSITYNRKTNNDLNN